MKEMLAEQIKGLNEILDTAKFNLVQKIDTTFKETFKLEDIEYSNLNVYRERAEFKCDDQWGGEVSLYYYETYDESTPKLEMSIPSFRDTNFSRVILYGKIAQQAQLYGEEFISKLQVLKTEYKNGISVVLDKLSEATRALRLIEQEEERVGKEAVLNALSTVGHVFEKTTWVQVKATDSVYVNSIRIEKTPGKKTYTFHYTYNEANIKWEGVREQYVMDLVNKINNMSPA
jgi:hypothetical protein